MIDFLNLGAGLDQPISIALMVVPCLLAFAMICSIIMKILRKQRIHPFQLVACVVIIIVLICIVYISVQFGQSHPIADPNYPG